MLKKITAILILIIWPLSLFLNNTFPNFLNYFTPAIIVLISYLLFKKNSKYYLAPLFLIPIVQPKLVLIPLLFTLLNFNKGKIIYLILSLAMLFVFLKPFYGQTILITNNDAREELIQKGNLYNSILLARIFQNKARIPLNKISDNFFALTDPNNYFFGFAPG